MEERHEQRPTTGRDDPDSLAPLQVERLSVDDEAALMKRGKRGQLFGLAAIGTLGALAAVLVLDAMESQQKHTDAMTAVRELHQNQTQAFVHCALPGVHSSLITSSARLHDAIERASERLGKDYARVLARCAPRLDGLVSGAQQLAVPKTLARELRALRTATHALQHGFAAYRDYLADERVPYDYVQALPRIEKIALAWANYEQRRARLEAALQAAL